jgi:uncharacterized repeat protein (TIGR03803 family)
MAMIRMFKSFLCVCFLGLFLGVMVQAQTFTTLVNFDGMHGAAPMASLIQGVDGALYGTTFNGGHNSCSGQKGCGTVFRVTTRGVLGIFGLKSQQGTNPATPLLLGTDGNYYGTTSAGGAYGYGTIFKISAAGVTTLHDFCADQNGCADGSAPNELVQGFDGNFYGTTANGANTACAAGCGTVFKITPSGGFSTLYQFSGLDGDHPMGRLVQNQDGNFYGATLQGGPWGAGSIFNITVAGALTNLHTFEESDGAFPYGGVILVSDGNFYGTTYSGGSNGDGTIFRMSPSGQFATLHYFNAGLSLAYSELVEGTDHSLYGTTYYGGDKSCGHGAGCGAIYRLSLDGTFSILHNFEVSDGKYPITGLVQATNGVFYGTVPEGGSNNGGTIYSLSVGLGPFVTFVRSAAKPGSLAGILGQGLTGTSVVSFNGMSSSFRVVSDTLIEATVPPGATTGYVTVTTPNGTLTSNKEFVVLK